MLKLLQIDSGLGSVGLRDHEGCEECITARLLTTCPQWTSHIRIPGREEHIPAASHIEGDHIEEETSCISNMSMRSMRPNPSPHECLTRNVAPSRGSSLHWPAHAPRPCAGTAPGTPPRPWQGGRESRLREGAGGLRGASSGFHVCSRVLLISLY